MNVLLQELEKQVTSLLPGEIVSIRQNTLGLYGLDHQGMIKWLKDRNLTAKFISETATIEGKRPTE
jgi:hypothetical protein